MAFVLTGITGVDMKPEKFSRELDGDEVSVQLQPMTPNMERAARDRAKVRADTDGLMVLGDMDKLLHELAVQVFDSWTIENDKGQTANISTQTILWLMDFSPEAATFVREAVTRSREIYRERRDERDEGDAEGN